jgi:hypothetical protein
MMFVLGKGLLSSEPLLCVSVYCCCCWIRRFNKNLLCCGVFREREREREREKCMSVLCMCVVNLWCEAATMGISAWPLNTCVVFCCDFIYYYCSTFSTSLSHTYTPFSTYSFTPNLNEIKILRCCQIAPQ